MGGVYCWREIVSEAEIIVAKANDLAETCFCAYNSHLEVSPAPKTDAAKMINHMLIFVLIFACHLLYKVG